MTLKTTFSAKVLISPFTESIQDWKDCFSKFRQGIFNFRWNFRINLSEHKPIFFKLPELLCKHFWRNTLHALLKSRETQLICPQLPENNGLPFASDYLQSGFHWTLVSSIVFSFARHKTLIVSILLVSIQVVCIVYKYSCCKLDINEHRLSKE